MRSPHAPTSTRRPIQAVVAGLVLLVSGCAAPVENSESTQQQLWHAALYEQRIDWRECDDSFALDAEKRGKLEESDAPLETFRCAMIEAPFDWNDAAGTEMIELAIVHVPATGAESQGVLFGNPGGPGASGLAYVYDNTMIEEFAEIMQSYDLVGFDPRGIGHSSPIECTSDSSLLVVALADCVEQNPLAAKMGTSQVARDMELLRHLFEQEKLHYLGYSYGTVLGATYSTLFPERVGRMVLDSAEDSDWSTLESEFDQERAIALAIAEMLTECGIEYEVEFCPLPESSTLLNPHRELLPQPSIASDGTVVGGVTLYGYLTDSLYRPHEERERALNTVGLIMRADQQAIDQVAEVMTSGAADIGLVGEVVRCHSKPSNPDVMGVIAHIGHEGLPDMLGGPEIDDEGLAPFLELGCAVFADRDREIGGPFSGALEAPILVLGITGDHATPYAAAENLVRELGHARLLTLDGRGHGASFTHRSSCADAAVTEFLIDGVLPEAGKICTDDLRNLK